MVTLVTEFDGYSTVGPAYPSSFIKGYFFLTSNATYLCGPIVTFALMCWSGPTLHMNSTLASLILSLPLLLVLSFCGLITCHCHNQYYQYSVSVWFPLQ